MGDATLGQELLHGSVNDRAIVVGLYCLHCPSQLARSLYAVHQVALGFVLVGEAEDHGESAGGVHDIQVVAVPLLALCHRYLLDVAHESGPDFRF